MHAINPCVIVTGLGKPVDPEVCWVQGMPVQPPGYSLFDTDTARLPWAREAL
jgi:hypothetical protein